MFCSLLFLVVILVANCTFAQGASIDDVLKSFDPGDSKTSTYTGPLDEGEGPRFDPMDVFDAIPRFRKEKEILEKKKEIVEAKGYDARM